MEEDDVTRKFINVCVPEEMHTWLQRNPGINKSEVFRDAINEIRIEQGIKVDYFAFQLRVILISCLGILLYILWPRDFFWLLIFIYMFMLFWILFNVLLFTARYKEVKDQWKKFSQFNIRKQENQK